MRKLSTLLLMVQSVRAGRTKPLQGFGGLRGFLPFRKFNKFARILCCILANFDGIYITFFTNGLLEEADGISFTSLFYTNGLLEEGDPLVTLF